MPSLDVSTVKIGSWDLESISLTDATRELALPILGLIGNSVSTSPSGKDRTATWKILVGTAVQRARGPATWSPAHSYAISLGFSFHAGSHGNQPLDVENFIKPALDAVAAGLFSAPDQDLATLARWGFDDSNFTRLLIVRLPNADSASREGLALRISAS